MSNKTSNESDNKSIKPKRRKRSSNSFGGRIKEHQQDIIRWAAIVGVVAIVSALMVMFVGVEKATYQDDAARYEQSLMTHGAGIDENDKRIDEIEKQGPWATEDDITLAMNQTATNTENITALDTRLTCAEGNITAICGDLDNLDGSPPEAWLTGNLTAGNITVHAIASSNGAYTANVHLVFASAAVNWTATVNWTDTNAKDYIAVENHEGNVTGCWWSIGTFDLVADTEKTINVLFGGLADTLSYAYVEIWSVLK